MIESVRRRKHTTHRKSDVTLEKKKKAAGETGARRRDRRRRLYFKMWGLPLMALNFLSALSPTADSPFKLSLRFKGN